MEDDRSQRGGMVDAAQFLRFSDALRADFAALAEAALPASSRERWQRRLLAITNLAKHDLDRAVDQHERFRGDLHTELGIARPGADDVEGR
jgi:uncharacterized NAD(P)/FAD-binding protein YdhS